MPIPRLVSAAAISALAALAALAPLGCSDYHESDGATSTTQYNDDRADATVKMFRDKDPSLEKFFKSAYGYAAFPKITKGAAGIGAANGVGGTVYEQGRYIGTAEMTQVTVGLQLGGQSYAELIFFQDKGALDNFKRSNMEFDANASAVATTSGAAASSDFDHGVAVFTMPLGGLMFEASIGGQKFRFTPKP